VETAGGGKLIGPDRTFLRLGRLAEATGGPRLNAELSRTPGFRYENSAFLKFRQQFQLVK
jgi:hypothetical protein